MLFITTGEEGKLDEESEEEEEESCPTFGRVAGKMEGDPTNPKLSTDWTIFKEDGFVGAVKAMIF
jgi:hypothetical protein